MTDNSDITFASVLNETKRTHLKSDLSNLAHAHVQLTKAIAAAKKKHEKYLEETSKLLTEIEETASSVETQDEGVVWELYRKAEKFYRV